MDKREFILELQDALSGEVSPQIIAKNVEYYQTYIDKEIQNGKSEAEVIEELGNARLLARTIIDTNGGDGDYDAEIEADYSKDDFYKDALQTTPEVHQEEEMNSGFQGSYHYIDMNKWYVKLAAVLVLIFVIVVVMAIASGIFTLAVWLAGPILIVTAIYLLYRYIRGKR